MRPGPFGRHSRAVSVLVGAAVVTALLAVGGRPEPEPETVGLVPSQASATAAAPTSPRPDPLSAPEGSTPSPTPAPDPLADAVKRAGRITASVEWASFTVLDRTAGRGLGDSRQDQVTNTESAVKAWLAADLLRNRAGRLSAWERTLMARMIRVSDDNAAQVIWRLLGADASIRRMIDVCGMTDTRVYPDWWSLTQISSRDLARLGNCIVPGRGRYLTAAEGTQLFALMRTVEKSNAFGIQQAEPAGRGVRVAVKNGWTQHGGTGLWNVNCLGIWGPDNRYVLAVTVRYPISKSLEYGANVCRRVTATLFPRGSD